MVDPYYTLGLWVQDVLITLNYIQGNSWRQNSVPIYWMAILDYQNAKVVKCQVTPTGVVVQGLRKASVCKTVHVKTVHNDGVLYLKIC